MKLTKGKCVFALAGLYSAADGEHDEENKDILQELIDEHFESSECRVESSLTRSNPPLELENYLKRIQELELKEKQWIETEKDYRDELKELKSNTPLKFEELKEGMWVWDNLNKEYIQIEWLDIEGESYKYLMAHTVPSNEYQRLYSNNRFYRREV